MGGFLANLGLYDPGKSLLLLCPCSVCVCRFEPQLLAQAENEISHLWIGTGIPLVAGGIRMLLEPAQRQGKVTSHSQILNDQDE